MSGEPAVRIWLGWRARHLAQDDAGFGSFGRQLQDTFVPATWLVMRKYGLRSYVPTLLRKQKAPHIPDETALLLYDSVASYEGHKATVAGRSYGVMHRALFEFDPGPRRSRSEWADANPAGGRGRTFRRSRTGQGLGFDSPGAVLIVTVLEGPAPGEAAAPVVFQALGHPECEAAAACERGMTLAWLAAPGGTAAGEVAQRLQQALGLPPESIVAAHAATPAELRFTDPDQPHPSAQHPTVPFGADQSVRFLVPVAAPHPP